MQLTFTKVHGSENDFFLLDETLLERSLTEPELVALTKIVTNRESGPLKGADGVLLVGKSERPEALGKMRVINHDGSEASMCGNGLRTVARYLSEKEKVTDFVVETMRADLQVKKAEELGEGIQTFQVEISPVLFNVDALPFQTESETFINQEFLNLAPGLRFSAVAVPNPHLISFVDHETLEGPLLEELATFFNSENPYFPDGVNVSFVEALSNNAIFVRTFERGVGFTNACGTAMSASSLMHVLLNDGELESKIQVFNPGGMVQTIVHQREDGNYWMELIGNATYTHSLEISLEDLLSQNIGNAKISEFNENEMYQKFTRLLK